MLVTLLIVACGRGGNQPSEPVQTALVFDGPEYRVSRKVVHHVPGVDTGHIVARPLDRLMLWMLSLTM